jgi:hypothetical protein
MSYKSTWARIFKIAKPVLTLGLSLLVAAIAKKNDANADVVGPLVNSVGTEIIDEADSALNTSADTSKATIPDSKNK